MARNISHEEAVMLGRLTLLMGKENMSSRDVDSANELMKQLNTSSNRDELMSLLGDSLKGSPGEFRDFAGDTTFPGPSGYSPPKNPEPVYDQLNRQMKQKAEDAMIDREVQFQPSDISKTLGYASVVPTSSEEARIRDLERAGFAMDMMNLEKMSMMDSAPMEDREEVSLGGQTYMLPRDPVARERYRKSLMQQQAQKDMMAAGASMPKGRGKIDSVNMSSMLADMRSRPSYDAGFRTGLEAVQHSGPLTLDKLRTMTGPGLSEDADRFRSYVSSEMPSGRFDADPQMIEELGYREALEATEQKMMQQQKDRVLTEGISFMPAAEEITIDDTGM
tara:strand:+ start:883 stop:1884 length:1002 start_codon:yes stop_codon:yes gene_type:complete